MTETVDTCTTEIADLESQLADAKEAAYAAIQPTVDEVLEKIEAGEDFDALIEQYGQDPGMETSPAKENGYPVSADSTNWVTEFRDAAMALANVGDVSEPVRSDYGIHIIKYVSDAVEGEVGLDAVRDALETEVLTQKQEEAYNAAVEAWVAEADAKIYKGPPELIGMKEKSGSGAFAPEPLCVSLTALFPPKAPCLRPRRRAVRKPACRARAAASAKAWARYRRSWAVGGEGDLPAQLMPGAQQLQRGVGGGKVAPRHAAVLISSTPPQGKARSSARSASRR